MEKSAAGPMVNLPPVSGHVIVTSAAWMGCAVARSYTWTVSVVSGFSGWSGVGAVDKGIRRIGPVMVLGVVE